MAFEENSLRELIRERDRLAQWIWNNINKEHPVEIMKAISAGMAIGQEIEYRENPSDNQSSSDSDGGK